MAAGIYARRTGCRAGTLWPALPPDLIELLLDRRPAKSYDWAVADSRISEMLDWPLACLLFDIQHGVWWSRWGERPADAAARREIVRDAVAKAPRLIPLIGHRFLPEMPGAAGNPVFSMHGFDSIYYGANLVEYFANEQERRLHVGPVRRIPFWSDIVEAGGEIRVDGGQ